MKLGVGGWKGGKGDWQNQCFEDAYHGSVNRRVLLSRDSWARIARARVGCARTSKVPKSPIKGSLKVLCFLYRAVSYFSAIL